MTEKLEKSVFVCGKAPDHGTVNVLLLLLLGGTTLVFNFFQDTEILNLYEITFVDNNVVKNRANFQPVVTSTVKKPKKLQFFAFLRFFDLLAHQMTLEFKFDFIRPT